MNWKFWKKEKGGENSAGGKEARIEKPKQMPQRVGMYLVTQLKEDPDWVWNLKCALRQKADEKNVFDIRIYDPVAVYSKGVTVANFNSLDAHPDMILFSGVFNKNTNNVQIENPLKNVA
jgi:hypothetical protein